MAKGVSACFNATELEEIERKQAIERKIQKFKQFLIDKMGVDKAMEYWDSNEESLMSKICK